MKKNLLFVLGLFISLINYAQETPPEVSRFLQVNTYNGGQLSHLVTDQVNNSYMTGVANGENFSFDGYNIKPIGNDDMFVIKTNANGQNQWLKTINSGKKGIIKPTKSYISGSGELFVTGSFDGTITFAGKTVSSATSGFFVVKYGVDGSEKWISTFLYNVVDMSFSGTDIFVAENYKIFKINNDDGSIDKSRDLSGVQFKINALYSDILNSGLFIGGVSNLTTTIDGIPLELNKGTILRGDYHSFIFSELAKFEVSDVSGVSEIFDLKMLADRSLAVVGLSSGATSFKNKMGQTSSANNSGNYSGSGYYFFTARIAPDFSSLNWFRTSTKLDQVRFSPNNNGLDALEIFAYDLSNFRVLFKRKTATGLQCTYPNGWVDYDQGFVKLFNYEYTNGLDNPSIDTWSDTFTNGFLTYNGYGVQRYDKTSLFWITGINGGFQKRKTDSEFGTLSSNYIKHTGTDGSLISYSHQCQKANYFGLFTNYSIGIGNQNNTCSDVISKIAPSGKPIWKSQLINAKRQDQTIYARYANVADNNTLGETVFVSQFTNQARFLDNNNVETDFTRQDNNLSNYVNLITNTNANGTLKWAKKLEPISASGNIHYTSVVYDNNQNVIVAGFTNDTFLMDDVAYNFNKKKVLFLMKLDANTGNVIFSKQFSDLDAYMMNLDTDNDNNIYLNFEPILENWGATSYSFGSVSVPMSESTNHLFLKFDSNGNTLLGKNFYENNTSSDYNYSWPFSLKFDGSNFIISGTMYTQNYTSYKGIDGQTYTNPYPSYNMSDFIAKLDKSGNIIWHKPIYSNRGISQNKTDVDELGNVYYYLGAKDKINIDGNETQLDTFDYSANLVKLSETDGSLKYLKNLGTHKNLMYNSSLSVLKNDILSFSGNADKTR